MNNGENLRDNRKNISKDSGIHSGNPVCSPNSNEYNSIPQERFYKNKKK